MCCSPSSERARWGGSSSQYCAAQRLADAWAGGGALGPGHYPLVMQVHPIGQQGIERATATIAMAFRHDPVWSVALGGQQNADPHHRSFWRFYVEGGQR